MPRGKDNPALEKQRYRFVVGHDNLLIACMKIATYNDHRSAPFFRALVVEQLPSLLGRRSRRRHLISPAWTFEYSDRDSTDTPDINYGSLTKITFPAGGSVSYTYNTFYLCDSYTDTMLNPAN